MNGTIAKEQVAYVLGACQATAGAEQFAADALHALGEELGLFVDLAGESDEIPMRVVNYLAGVSRRMMLAAEMTCSENSVSRSDVEEAAE